MEKITKDRVRLIRRLEECQDKQSSALSTRARDALHEATRIIRRDDQSDFLSFSQQSSNRISYAPKPELAKNNNRRVCTTLGRYFRRQLNFTSDHIKDNELATISNFIYSKDYKDEMKAFQILTGYDIENEYSDGRAWQSCMSDEYAHYTRIYVNNPDTVQLLYYEGALSPSGAGRALIWQTDTGQTVLDRIYPNDGNHVALYHEYAKSKGWIHRRSQALPPETEDVRLSDNSTHIVTLDKPDNGYYPYIDTFCYGAIKDNHTILTNAYNTDLVQRRFQSTSGGSALLRFFTCHLCGERNTGGGYSIRAEGDYRSVCHDCYYPLLGEAQDVENNSSFVCVTCHELIGESHDTNHATPVRGLDRRYVCSHCANHNSGIRQRVCAVCGHYSQRRNPTFSARNEQGGNVSICSACYPTTENCDDCQRLTIAPIQHNNSTLCSICLGERMRRDEQIEIAL